MWRIMTMNKSILLIFVFLVILMTPLTFPHNFVSLAEAQQQSAPKVGSSTNVTDLIKSNSQNSSTPLVNKTVNYFGNVLGYLVYPLSSSSSSIQNNNNNNNKNNNTIFPAVVMIHENKGLNDNIKNMANLLAREGYVILAVDLFNGEVTTDQKRASELTQSIRDNPD